MLRNGARQDAPQHEAPARALLTVETPSPFQQPPGAATYITVGTPKESTVEPTVSPTTIQTVGKTVNQVVDFLVGDLLKSKEFNKLVCWGAVIWATVDHTGLGTLATALLGSAGGLGALLHTVDTVKS
jgi:hypothetical protein